MIKKFFIFLILISCNNYLPTKINNNYTIDNNIIINDIIHIKEGGVLSINSDYKIKLKKNSGFLIDGGVLNLKGNFYDSLIIKPKNILKIKIINNGKLKVFKTSIYNSSIISNNSEIEIIKSNILSKNLFLDLNNSNLYIDSCYIKGYKKKFNFSSLVNSKILINNTIIKNFNNSFLLDSCNSFIINNSILKYIEKECFLIKNSDNITLSNCIFLENNLIINSENSDLRVFNNLIIKNEFFSKLNFGSSLFLINNTFDSNKNIITANKGKNKIISKNNILYNTLNYFDLNNNSYLSNSFCVYNKDTLFGYYNIKSDPNFIDPINYDYNLKTNSPAKRAANNNTNIGVNTNTINIIKYLN